MKHCLFCLSRISCRSHNGLVNRTGFAWQGFGGRVGVLWGWLWREASETFPVSHGQCQHFQGGPSKAEAISNRGSVSESPTRILI